VADHINIRAPRDLFEMEDRFQKARLEAEMKVLQTAYETVRADLDSIFTRIGRGEQVELHYPDGKVVLITKAKKRGNGEPDET